MKNCIICNGKTPGNPNFSKDQVEFWWNCVSTKTEETYTHLRINSKSYNHDLHFINDLAFDLQNKFESLMSCFHPRDIKISHPTYIRTLGGSRNRGIVSVFLGISHPTSLREDIEDRLRLIGFWNTDNLME